MRARRVHGHQEFIGVEAWGSVAAKVGIVAAAAGASVAPPGDHGAATVGPKESKTNSASTRKRRRRRWRRRGRSGSRGADTPSPRPNLTSREAGYDAKKIERQIG